MTQAPLLQDLATVMIVASIMVFVMHYFRQPAIIGYLLAGLAIGPHTPPFALVRDVETIRIISDLGLVFLMFALGLEFSLPRFRRAGPSAGISAAVVVIGMVLSGYALGRLFGWSRVDSAFLGAMLSISGSSVIAKVFMDMGLTRERFANSVFGLMISDDIAAMVMLSAISGLGAASLPGIEAALTPLLRIAFFVLLFLLGGLVVVPRLISAVSRYQSPEMSGILTVGLCLGSAFVASNLGFSLALGAFLIGAIVASTPQAPSLGEWMKPIRSMFSALFFVSAGMLVDPAMLWEHKGPVAVIAVATIVLRGLLGAAASAATGKSLTDSVKIGVSISQIGEFSFVIAGLGVSLGLASGFLYPTAVVVSSVTMFFTPLLIERGDAIALRFAASFPGLSRRLDSYHAAIQGFATQGQERRGGAVYGRYTVRLVAYFALVVGLALGAQRAAEALAGAPVIWLWMSRAVCAAASLPLSLLVAKYVSHVFLLVVTQLLSLPRMEHIFERVNIRLVYNLFHAATLAALAAFLILVLAPGLEPAYLHLLIAVGLSGVAEALASRLAPAVEWVEARLDEAFGRATSEPTRYAILMLGDRRSLFYDLTEQVLLKDDSASVGRSIESLELRRKTGVSIAAIYRAGEHLTNPAPDTVLADHDLVVLLGEPEQRERAARLLLLGE